MIVSCLNYFFAEINFRWSPDRSEMVNVHFSEEVKKQFLIFFAINL